MAKNANTNEIAYGGINVKLIIIWFLEYLTLTVWHIDWQILTKRDRTGDVIIIIINKIINNKFTIKKKIIL